MAAPCAPPGYAGAMTAGLDADVVVVGGGLAGASTALGLAARGHHVIVLDRARFPRDKVCGEGLMPHGARALAALGVPVPVGAPFQGIRWTAGGVTAVGVFGDGLGVGMRRRLLDDALLGAASDHPRIDVRTGQGAQALRVDASGVTVDLDDGAVRGRLVVGADGLHSQVRRWCGLERARGRRRRYGVRQHLRLAAGIPDEPWVDVELADGAELYVTPVGPGEVNVAALCEHDAARTLKGGAAAALARWILGSKLGPRFADAVPVDEARVTGPLRQLASAVVSDRVLLVGDAAGFVDGITGEGMSSTLGSAALAAEIGSGALAAGALDRDALAPYARRHAALVRESRWLTELILWGVRHRWLAERVVRNLARRPELFDGLLAIETGNGSFRELGVGGLLGLVT